MKRFTSKLLFIIGIAFCLYFLVSSFTYNFNSGHNDDSNTEKNSGTKIQNKISVKSISKHLLDFNR